MADETDGYVVNWLATTGVNMLNDENKRFRLALHKIAAIVVMPPEEDEPSEATTLREAVRIAREAAGFED